MQPPSKGTAARAAVAFVLLAAVGLAFKGIFVKLALLEGLGSIGALALRVAFACPLFWIGGVALTAPGERPAGVRDRVLAVLCGLFYIVAALSDFLAIEDLGASLSRVILFSFPGFLLLFDAVHTRRLPPRAQLLAFLVAWLGLVLVVAPAGLGAGSGSWVGVVFGLLSAATYAFYLRFAQGLTRRMGSPAFASLANVGTALGALLLLPWMVTPGDFDWTWLSLLWIALLASVSTAIPFFLLFEGIRRLGAAQAGLLTLIGPPITVGAAWLLLGERLGPLQLLGAALVLLGVGGLRIAASSAVGGAPARERSIRGGGDTSPEEPGAVR